MTRAVGFLTTSEVARSVGVDPSTVRRWVLGGTLRPAVTTVGGHHRFAESDVAKLLEPPAALVDTPEQASE